MQRMKMSLTPACVLVSALCLSSLMAASAFSVGNMGLSPALGGSRRSVCESSFSGGASQLAVAGSGAVQRDSRAKITGLRMGKQAAFGPFTPAVVAVRTVVGEKKFNQIRGKVITEFCVYAGVPRDLRQGLIRLAKTNGNTLGFLS